MKKNSRSLLIMLAALLSTACNNAAPSASPEPLSDTFFAGCAYIDQNGNAALDPGEPLLAGFTFTVTLAGGAGFGAKTSEGQCATIIVPSALPKESWPVIARMVTSGGAGYEAVGSSEVVLEYPQTKADFQFIIK